MSSALVPVVPADSFSQEQIEIIRKQVAPEGTTPDELALFLQYFQRTGLDPFARQIYLSERRAQDSRGNWIVTRKPETTIDGFRVIAERAGKYAGQLGPQWCGDDGVWRDVWTPQQPPTAARVGILRHDFLEPLWAVALYDEYCQRKKDGAPNSMWAKMPANQLAKCAESLALRRAFPRELSGLYTREEMPDPKIEAKEAQQDYLAERLAEIRKPKEVPAEIKAFADIDPEPTQGDVDSMEPMGGWQGATGTRGLEIRHAAEVAEAEALLKEQTPPKSKKEPFTTPVMTVDRLKKMGEIKDRLRELSGTDTIYYSTLKAKGYEHANKIDKEKDAMAIWKVLQAEINRLTQEAELLALFEHSAEAIGQREFANILGVHACETIADAMKLGGDPLAALLAELKARVDEKQPQVTQPTSR